MKIGDMRQTLKRNRETPARVIYEPGNGPKEQAEPKRFHDPKYADDAAVNRKPTTTYADAMAKKERRELVKPVLTERGYVIP